MLASTNYKITELRKNIASIVDEVETTGNAISIVVKNRLKAIMAPKEFKELANRYVKYSEWLALMFTKRFLSDAPKHFIEPQIMEFKNIDFEKLLILFKVDSLPVKGDLRNEVISILGEKVLDRLEKRYKIAKIIEMGDKENLSEALEHQTGELDFK